jgi:hypothetical protein
LKRILAAVCALALAACGTIDAGRGDQAAAARLEAYRPFSASPVGLAVPLGWQNWLFGPLKPATEYQTRIDPLSGLTIVAAHADKSASALLLSLDAAAAQPRYVSWRWRTLGLIDGADVSDAAHEDSPVRLLLGFEGDHSKLSFRDQMFAERVKLMSGQDMPYATLMYVWANGQAPESIIANPHTGRIRMLVVEAGGAHVGTWQQYTRDIRADYRRAFGEDPGPLVMVGIMTDTDNTQRSVEAEYGDIRLLDAP